MDAGGGPAAHVRGAAIDGAMAMDGRVTIVILMRRMARVACSGIYHTCKRRHCPLGLSNAASSLKSHRNWHGQIEATPSFSRYG